MTKDEQIDEINRKRKERLDLCEESYTNPECVNYRDNERYSWAIKKINEIFDERVNQLNKEKDM